MLRESLKRLSADLPSTTAARLLPVILLLTPLITCSDGDLRGNSVPSRDGGTYLVFDDNHGGTCDPLMVDGHAWGTPIYAPARIEAGTHPNPVRPRGQWLSGIGLIRYDISL